MNKKVIAIVLLVALALVPVFAKSYSGTAKKDSLAVGLNLGICTGVTAKYGMGDFDFQGTVGFGTLSNGLSFEAGAYYNFYDITFKTGSNAIEKAASKTQTISCVAGPVAGVSLSSNGVSVAAMGVAGLEYTFAKAPFTVYLKAGLGVELSIGDDVKTALAGTGALGCVYTF
ncbi:MAG: hypothetical protein KBS81_06865 [Spirochaetales bacterium]|nr:hypothetical protein [Candidatus Physcosoma equi]